MNVLRRTLLVAQRNLRSRKLSSSLNVSPSIKVEGLTLPLFKLQPSDPEYIQAVPWFPRTRSDLDMLGSKSLEFGAELEADHPGFLDAEYRARRKMIVQQGQAYRYGTGEPVPDVEYTAEENGTWELAYGNLKKAADKHAVSQFNEILEDMEIHCGYGDGKIPQLQDISAFLMSRTGFTLRPVTGLLTPRDFLNGLAMKTFFSTQYIRHHSRPFYTPEPDVIHELVGHAPMLADPDFAELSHEVGLASLGATDEQIEWLATAYWFSVEFGLCKENGAIKGYGAGVLSSVDEMLHACEEEGRQTPNPEYRTWDPKAAAVQPYPITTVQPVYYVAESLADAKERMRDFARGLDRSFSATYDHHAHKVVTSRAVARLPAEE
mmetsp:Transcript_27620/g.43123  ORF Transcript_27620/g.43123 Transcript_27620/m.43123 type:complete len:378 (-) Transcript_27620:106-1239(-)|eukprot:CAMPEP_0184326890 /NCGR_PEP_ID=MMETSP1049-20130417/142806_1 /TAXON_ID=77928 /ORGANISM="Proteomonas sulcata, Strain CCMP704" /LENGTH=377 /DNA_ID=CAMNT_0026649117 /DNA_START=61 /DNA_END=1194 /DNA_ORIENTATION=+